jgi:hypothetical protein
MDKNVVKCVILVDNSNIFIEGQKQSARVKGIQKASPHDKDICDPPGASTSAASSRKWRKD